MVRTTRANGAHHFILCCAPEPQSVRTDCRFCAIAPYLNRPKNVILQSGIFFEENRLMTYTVKYRDKSGDIVELELDVPNKNAVWTELKKRGISALSVQEGVVKKRPSKKSGKTPSAMRGLIAGLCVVVLAAFVAWWFFFKDAQERVPPADDAKTKRVKEVKPAKLKPAKPAEQFQHSKSALIS